MLFGHLSQFLTSNILELFEKLGKGCIHIFFPLLSHLLFGSIYTPASPLRSELLSVHLPKLRLSVNHHCNRWKLHRQSMFA